MIETKDLLLRSGRVEDWYDLYQNLWSREEVFSYLFSRPSPNEEAGKKRTLAYVEMHREVPTEFFVEEKTTGRVIGIAGLKELAPGHWTVTDVAIGPDWQGRGYGVQVVSALADYAFYQRGAAQVGYECFAENMASKHLAQSCGFVYTRSGEAETLKNGEKVILDHYIRTK